MTENTQKAQRITRLVSRTRTYTVKKPVKHENGDLVVQRIAQVGETTFRVDFLPTMTKIGDIEVERQINRFTVVFNPESINMEEMEMPKVVSPQGVVS